MEAVSRTAVPTGPPEEGVAWMIGVRLRMLIVKVWHTGGVTPLPAHTVVGPNVPVCDGRPAAMPPGPMVIPGGKAPLVTENVAGGTRGVDVNRNAYVVPTSPLGGGGLVMEGAACAPAPMVALKDHSTTANTTNSRRPRRFTASPPTSGPS